MPCDGELAEFLENATKANFDKVMVQKQAIAWLKRELSCEESVFLIYDRDKKRFVCQICGNRDYSTSPLDAGPSSSWQSSFNDKNCLEFKELPVDLATNLSAIFSPLDVTLRPITLHALRSPRGVMASSSSTVVPLPHHKTSTSSNGGAGVALTPCESLIAVCCVAHSEPRTLICCRGSRDLSHRRRNWTLPGGSLDNFLRTVASLLSVSSTLDSQKAFTKQCECLLSTAQAVFSNLENMSKLASNIIREARRLVPCEYCVLFIVDRDNYELIAYWTEESTGGATSDIKNSTSALMEPSSKQTDIDSTCDLFSINECRLTQGKGVVGAVADSGWFLRLSNPVDNPNFDSNIDNISNRKLRNLMCVPIKDKHGTLAVVELCNRSGTTNFHESDEQAALSFSVYCSTSISHCLLYRRLQEAHRRSNMASELMLYHTQKIAEEDVLRLSLCHIPRTSTLSEDFSKFSFIPRSIPVHDTLTVCLSMFDDLGFLTKYRIKRKTLSRFLLLVEKGYRDVPYHNWSHAFAVAHFCYLLLKLVPLTDYLTDLECLSLFVACLCHDIDHRGTTNSFQVQSKTMLAQLYSSEGSVLERHHFAQTMCILNIENCNIFDALPAQDYQIVLDNMRDFILATDIAQHLRLRKGMEQMTAKGFAKTNKHHHYLLSCLAITACDLSDQTKKWPASKQIAGQIYTEFFSQGDLEKAMGNTPNLMMDRERACVPKLQIDFLDTIALPCYRLLAKQFSETQSVYASIYHSRRCWVMMHKILGQTYEGHSKCNLDVLSNKELEEEVSRVVGPPEIVSPDDLVVAIPVDKEL